MRRKVFIVGSPLSYEVKAFYNGVKADVQNFYNFFKSPTGGAFSEYEIECIENPNIYQLRNLLQVNPTDFSIFVFSGHGYYEGKSGNTVFNINSYQTSSVLDIVKLTKSPRQFIITDTCRKVHQEERFLGSIGDITTHIDFPSNLSHDQARRLHINALGRMGTGIQILYSCSKGELSSISYDGSDFSKSLLTSTRNWATYVQRGSILLGQGAHRFSNIYLKKRLYNDRQNPRLFTTHNDGNFPFAVRYGEELM